MTYTIIEDCSPYYIRFTHDNIQEIIDVCKQELTNIQVDKLFVHYTCNDKVSKKILNLIPMSQQYEMIEDRVSIFVTPPGFYYRPHKDAINHRISLNYTIQVLDNECVTSWYSDKDLAEYPVTGLIKDSPTWKHPSREVNRFDKTKHTPVKSMTARPDECILFNTDIFHDFDNTKSNNVRAVLTLRVRNPGIHYFANVKKTLFG
jgi:hypothetical protein